MIVDVGMNRGELLQRLHVSKTQHASLPSPERKVRILGPVVQPTAHFAAVQIAEFPHSCWIGFQAIGDVSFRFPVPLQRIFQNPQSRSFFPFLGNVAFQDLAFVINRTPEVMHLAVDLYINLIDMLLPLLEAPHSAYALAANIRCEQRSETVNQNRTVS